MCGRAARWWDEQIKDKINTRHEVYYIVHPESFRSNEQNAIAFARRNRPRVNRSGEFAYVYLRLFVFAFACICEYCLRSSACAYV